MSARIALASKAEGMSPTDLAKCVIQVLKAPARIYVGNSGGWYYFLNSRKLTAQVPRVHLAKVPSSVFCARVRPDAVPPGLVVSVCSFEASDPMDPDSPLDRRTRQTLIL